MDIYQHCLSQPKICSQFKEITQVGEGGYGHVYKAIHLTDKHTYALKVIPVLESEDYKKTTREVEILAKLSNESVITYKTSFEIDCEKTDLDWLGKESHANETNERTSTASLLEDWTGKFLCIQMEYCHQTLRDFIDKGDLFLKTNSEDLYRIVLEILAGVQYIHKEGIIHRDLKPENIFMDSTGHVKLGDFGLARPNTSATDQTDTMNQENVACGNLTHTIGTGAYMAPEIKSSITEYGPAVDIYSLGIILFEMIYQMESLHQRATVIMNVRKSTIEFPDDLDASGINTTVLDCIKHSLNHDPKRRLSAKDMESRLIETEVEDRLATQISENEATALQFEDNPNDNTIEDNSTMNQFSNVFCMSWIMQNIYHVKWGNRNSKSVGFAISPGVLVARRFIHNPNLGFPNIPCIVNKLLYRCTQSKLAFYSIVESKKRPDFLYESVCNSQIRNIFVYLRDRSFIKTSLHPIPDETDNIKLALNTEYLSVIYITTPSSNIGAPVYAISDIAGSRPCVVGIIVDSFYMDGKKIGSFVLSIRGIYEILPQEIRLIIFKSKPKEEDESYSSVVFQTCPVEKEKVSGCILRIQPGPGAKKRRSLGFKIKGFYSTFIGILNSSHNRVDDQYTLNGIDLTPNLRIVSSISLDSNNDIVFWRASAEPISTYRAFDIYSEEEKYSSVLPVVYIMDRNNELYSGPLLFLPDKLLEKRFEHLNRVHLRMLDTIMPKTSVGSPVLIFREEPKEPEVYGIFIDYLYLDGQQYGSLVISLQGVYEMMPSHSLRMELFSGAQYWRDSTDYLVAENIRLKEEIEKLKPQQESDSE